MREPLAGTVLKSLVLRVYLNAPLQLSLCIGGRGRPGSPDGSPELYLCVSRIPEKMGSA